MRTVRFAAAIACLCPASFGQSTTPAPTAPAPAAQPVPAKPTETAAPAAPKLGIGDPAPALNVNSWVKGGPISNFQRNKVYAIEFWSTNCPPCRKTTPVLSELQDLFKDKGLTVIGISVGEPGGLPDVEAYAKRFGPLMAYTVGYDSAGRTAQTYLQGAGQDGLPCAFVIDGEGRIAWIGHPLDGLDRVLSQIFAGKFDAGKARAAYIRRAAADTRARPLITELENRFVAGNTDKALETMDQLAAIDPPFTGDWAVNKFAFLLLQKKDAAQAYAYANASLDGVIKDNADALKAMSWMILAEPGVEPRDCVLATKLARRADDITSHADASVLDTLARALFDTGQAEEAAKVEAAAVEACLIPSQKRDMDQRLRQYKGDPKADKK